MKYVKGTFKALLKSLKVEETNGYISEDGEIAISKNGDSWSITDIYSGATITSLNTKKACIEWVDNFWNELKKSDIWKRASLQRATYASIIRGK